MRLLQLSTGPGQLLDLHPNFTVVTDLDDSSRRALVDAVAGLAELRAAGTAGLLEAHGVLFDLDATLLGALELTSPSFDPIVRTDQLPTAPLSVDAQELRRRQARFEEVLEQVSAHVAAQAEARAEVEATARELATATEELRHAQGEGDAGTGAERGTSISDAGSGDQPASQPDERRDVGARLEEIEHLLIVLTPLDSAPVTDALAALREVDLDATVPSPEGAARAEALDRAEADLAAAPAPLREVGEGALAEARSRLDDARQALLEAEHAARNPVLDPASVAQLEAAHDVLLEAAEHADARFAGARAQRRVAEARASEQEVLDRLGFVSYSDYMMGHSAVHADPGRQAALEEARLALEEAEEEWATLEAAAEAGLVRGALLDRRRTVRDDAARLLGGAPVDGAALRALRQPAPEVAVVADRLRSALATVGMDLADEDLEPDELSLMAEAWLDEVERLDDRRRELVEERDALQARREELEGESPMPTTPVAVADSSTATDPAAAEGGATDAARRHAAAIARLEEEDRILHALDAEGRVAAAEVERLQELVEGQPSEATTPGEALEWYLLARLAAQRMVSVAGSCPLLLDQALRRVPDADVDQLLARLEAMAEAVQVIVVSDDARVAAWASEAGPVRAAVVRPVAVTGSQTP